MKKSPSPPFKPQKKNSTPPLTTYLRLLRPSQKPAKTESSPQQSSKDVSPTTSSTILKRPFFFERTEKYEKNEKTDKFEKTEKFEKIEKSGSPQIRKDFSPKPENLNRSKLMENNGAKLNFLFDRVRNKNLPIRVGVHKKSGVDDKIKMCCYHVEKKAKYMKLNEDTVSSSAEELENKVFFCSKCAIDLALKGVRVVDLESNNEAPKFFASSKGGSEIEENNADPISHRSENNSEKIKKNNIEEFLSRLDSAQSRGSQTFAILNLRKNEIKLFYDNFYIEMRNLFEKIVKRLDVLQKSLVLKLQQNKEELELGLNTNITQVNSSLKDMQSIRGDIGTNMLNIIQSMDVKPFQLILSKYEQKISTYEQFFEILARDSQYSLPSFPNKDFEQEHLEETIWKSLSPLFDLNYGENKEEKHNNKPPEVYVSFDNKEIFEEPMERPYTPKISPAINKTKPVLSDSASPNTHKYRELLQKVHHNQENKNIFFEKLTKAPAQTGAIASNQIIPGISGGGTQVGSFGQAQMGTLKKKQGVTIGKKLIYESDKFVGEKENEDFHRFFEKMEDRLGEEIVRMSGSKNLFCSPHFKEKD